jgi:pimeloyl-ACP methyl ester carboxylesterase
MVLIQTGPKIEWTAAEVTFGGETLTVRRGTLEVPERHEGLSRILKLPVAVLPARGGAKGAPVVFLHGGPGGSGIRYSQSGEGAAFFSAMRDAGDVVLFDQRGGGMATPNGIVPLDRPLPEDWLLTRERFCDALLGAAKTASAHLEGKLDLAQYTTVENAKDLDLLRQALGAEKIRILAHSYGTHLAQVFIRKFPDRVESAVLMGTEGLDMTMKLPSTYKLQLEQLTELIKLHPNTRGDVPNFARLLELAVKNLDRQPLVAMHEGKQYKIGGFGLMWLLRFDIGDSSDLPLFPRIVHAAWNGDVEPLMPMFRKRYAQLSSGFPVVSLVMDGASGASPERLAQIKKESEGFFFAPVVNLGVEALAGQLGVPVLGPEFRQPVRTDVPTLFVSGNLDSNTPPIQAEEVRKGFSRSWHLVLRNAGHEDCLWNPEAMRAIVAFLNSGRSESRTINLPDIEFLPILRAPGSHPLPSAAHKNPRRMSSVTGSTSKTERL